MLTRQVRIIRLANALLRLGWWWPNFLAEKSQTEKNRLFPHHKSRFTLYLMFSEATSRFLPFSTFPPLEAVAASWQSAWFDVAPPVSRGANYSVQPTVIKPFAHSPSCNSPLRPCCPHNMSLGVTTMFQFHLDRGMLVLSITCLLKGTWAACCTLNSSLLIEHLYIVGSCSS